MLPRRGHRRVGGVVLDVLGLLGIFALRCLVRILVLAQPAARLLAEQLVAEPKHPIQDTWRENICRGSFAKLRVEALVVEELLAIHEAPCPCLCGRVFRALLQQVDALTKAAVHNGGHILRDPQQLPDQLMRGGLLRELHSLDERGGRQGPLQTRRGIHLINRITKHYEVHVGAPVAAEPATRRPILTVRRGAQLPESTTLPGERVARVLELVMSPRRYHLQLAKDGQQAGQIRFRTVLDPGPVPVRDDEGLA
mmetsp:Transcript_104548/g.265376  ORF Transcript_104548/g.265376 Transcript_104548/m.265376 type:complete len:253 (+) Transcript_104548:200-958(+)